MKISGFILNPFSDTKTKIKILAYCLMGNHAHIFAIPEERRSPKEE
jgi:REP element-mobilizing transposase RayT